jgi:putative colanic acid biosynthesis glycosyltransferase WcaI
VRLLFLNQYFPPDAAPTGVLFRELGEHLAARGHEVRYVSSGQSYRVSRKGGRLLREASALWAMLVRGLRGPRADTVISGTSPPCLLLVARLIARRHRARSAHWLMDMYPELALALGELREGALPRWIAAAMGRAYRKTDLVVALDDDMAARLKDYGVPAEIIPAWLPRPLAESAGESAIRNPQSAIPTWIYSGNLGRAHEWETLLDAQALLEKRNVPFALVFQGGGPAWSTAQRRARELGLKRCEWNGYVEERDLRDSLLRCHVLIATQRPETRGLLWPSKLALIRELPRPIVWVGPVDGAVARELRTLPRAGIFAPGQAEDLANWLAKLRAEGVFAWEQPSRAAAHRQAALERWTELVNKIGR